jgi:hypothetical protein
LAPAVDQRPETRPILVLDSRETFSDDLGGFGERVPGRGSEPADTKGVEAFVLRRLLVGLRRVGGLVYPVWLWRGDAPHAEPDIVLTFGDNRVVGVDLVRLAAHDDLLHRATLADDAAEQASRRPHSGVSERWLCLADVEDRAEAADFRAAAGGLLSEIGRKAPVFRRICLVEPLHLTIVEADGGVHTIDLSTDYDIDFAAWADEQARLAREKGVNALDLPHVAEELRDLGRNQVDKRDSHLTTLLMHLLKWQFQPRRRSRSWRLTILRCRRDLERVFAKSPSLNPLTSRREDWDALLRELYRDARDYAIAETGLPASAFPETCPYTIDQILDPDFLPGPVRDEDLQP